jgi:hypothetical protein
MFKRGISSQKFEEVVGYSNLIQDFVTVIASVRFSSEGAIVDDRKDRN